ncbi:adenylate/guanylate cyclase domain-containing protein [Lampropedia aestuarii]|uniref:Adenylate/guanylate cyclase domain-containing protein n=1 Tax=Lampropedia aestuarii TaxID=2562762 RepID=A0A4S5BU41_9BURK|nr:adenylate/guanylate cyclase domain-containing protein [Lampropedia aestuarii]THJ35989.1 adenylate/guanylate cyclase domain-containing protein [Lampropedia aestuarii]
MPFFVLLSSGLSAFKTRCAQGLSVRSLRWYSGWILFAYVLLHLLNHATGLVSLSAAETMRIWVHSLWRSTAGTLLLYGALVLHAALALVAVAQRRTWRMPLAEAVRLAFGLMLPLLMSGHIVATRWASANFGVINSYERIVAALWTPWSASIQTALLIVAWVHGCMGLHFAFRARRGWQHYQPILLSAAVLLPVLASLGVLAMGREMDAANTVALPASAAAAQSARWMKWGLRWGWCLLLGLALIGPWLLRHWRQRTTQAQRIQVHYPERVVAVPVGYSILEASRAHGIAHLSLCGGRARCSTCRVRVRSVNGFLPEASADERRTLDRVRASADVRLACQLRPQSDVYVTPLFNSTTAKAHAHDSIEQEVVVFFIDLRQWSALSDQQWPTDLSWLLSGYFSIVGAAIQDSGGIANQFIGDSVMAIFGHDTELPTAAQQALKAAARIEQQMDEWSETLMAKFGQRLNFGIGIHAGNVLLGQVGFDKTTTFTAVGEVVNTTSRLQDHSKIAQVRLVVSAKVAELAGIDHLLGYAQAVQLRGRSQALQVYSVAHPSALYQL